MPHPEYIIETGIQIPLRKERLTGYPFHQMAIGDSFLVPHIKEEPTAKEIERLRMRIYAAAKRHARHARGFTVKMRRVKEGYRVWRAT